MKEDTLSTSIPDTYTHQHTQPWKRPCKNGVPWGLGSDIMLCKILCGIHGLLIYCPVLAQLLVESQIYRVAPTVPGLAVRRPAHHCSWGVLTLLSSVWYFLKGQCSPDPSVSLAVESDELRVEAARLWARAMAQRSGGLCPYRGYRFGPQHPQVSS